MSSKTTNYNLHKIDLNDSPPDITVLNQNFDTIDAELKKRLDGEGDTMEGNLLYLENGKGHIESRNDHMQMTSFDTEKDDNNFRSLAVNNKVGRNDLDSAVILHDCVNGTTKQYKIYGEHNKPNAESMGALPSKLKNYEANPKHLEISVGDHGLVTNVYDSTVPNIPVVSNFTHYITINDATNKVDAVLSIPVDYVTDSYYFTKADGKWHKIADAAKFLPLSDGFAKTDVIPLANGGTGATDAATARTNLGITPSNIGAVPSTGGTVSGVITAKQFAQSDYGNPLEIGAYIDMHKQGSTADFDMRLSINSDGSPNINIPNKGVYNLYGTHNITASTTDLTAGTSTLASGNIYLVYE